jgi:hypothetical protein
MGCGVINMDITAAQYIADITGSGKNVSIKATIDGTEMSVPLDPDNRHYAEIQKQVAAGELTIEDAD